MSSSKKRRQMLDDDLPALLLVPGLVNLVMQCVPKLQMRQWIRDTTGIEQAKLVAWMPKKDQNKEIVKAIVKQDNVQAFCNLKKDLQFISIESSSTSIVKHMLRCNSDKIALPDNADVADDDVFECFMISPLRCNYIMLLRDIISKQNNDRLKRLLESCTDVIEIGEHLGHEFQSNIWNMVRPYILSKRLTMQKVSVFYLTRMSVEAFLQLPSSITYNKQTLFDTALCFSNWNLAAHLFELAFSDFVYDYFTFSVEVELKPDFLLSNVTLETPNKFECLQNWWDDSPWREGDMMSLNNFLTYYPCLEKSENKEWQDVTYKCVQDLLSNRLWQEKCWIFERSCIAGFENVVFWIWNSVSADLQNHLRHLLLNVRVSATQQLYEFAWQHNSDAIRTHALEWIQCAFNNNNVALWQFLDNHNFLSQDLLFAHQEIATPPHLEPCPNLFLSLAYKPAQMLEQVWDDCVPTQQQINTLARLSFLDSNQKVLCFLDAHNVKIDSACLSMHLSLICKFNLRNFALQVKNAPHIPQKELFDNDRLLHNVFRLDEVWNDATFHYIEQFLYDTELPSLEICLFLLRKKYITPHKLLSFIRAKSDSPCMCDEIHAFTYCEVDE